MCLLFELRFVLGTERSAFQLVEYRGILRRSRSCEGARLEHDIDENAVLLRDQHSRRSKRHQLRNYNLELPGDSDTSRCGFSEC